ncbi:AAA family ATPase [Methylotuvimicrobium sp. KM2]|uniref:AAA family ATPase n=1 Tax=Methylotuvimicrobium sp. KM2 TaxID=3133976 RepID=UPI003100F114
MYTHNRNHFLRHYLKNKALNHSLSAKHEQFDPNQISALVQVFDTVKMDEMLSLHDRKSNLYRNHQRYLHYLEDSLGLLPLSRLSKDIFSKLDDLALKFPNFVNVIEFYREQFALALMNESPTFTANPLLISGPPGVGKTAFCRALAKIIDTYFEFVSFSGITAGFVLGGMSSNWADGKPGRIVETLARGLKANPLIMLDEIDKCGGDKRYDPLGSLYQLLEKETASTFVDEGLEIATDCSYVVWVATANHCELIAEPILSRFTILEVNPPNKEQMKAVLQSIYDTIRQQHTWGSQFSEHLSSPLVEKIILSRLEPRLLQRELIAACGKAALRNTAEDGKISVFPEDFVPRQKANRLATIGFI